MIEEASIREDEKYFFRIYFYVGFFKIDIVEFGGYLIDAQKTDIILL